MHLTNKDLARLEAGLAPPDANGCRFWTRAIAATGYGNIRIAGVTYLTHRVAYTAVHGGIPEGLHLDHLCRNKPCGEVTHLEAVSPRENTLRARPFRPLVTHCKRNHPLIPGQVRVYNGARFCKACDRIRGRAYIARKKASQ